MVLANVLGCAQTNVSCLGKLFVFSVQPSLAKTEYTLFKKKIFYDECHTQLQSCNENQKSILCWF